MNSVLGIGLAIVVVAGLVSALATNWVVTSFLMVPSALKELQSGLKLPIGVRVVVYWNMLKGYLGDFLYNTLVGTIRFHELPQWQRGELMYSARVQRHIDVGRYSHIGWSAADIYQDGFTTNEFCEAYEWALILNTAWPDHIHLGPVSGS